MGAMKVSPISAGTAFGVLLGTPLMLAVVLLPDAAARLASRTGVTLPVLVIIAVVNAVVSGLLFGLGARISKHQHSLTSVLKSWLLTLIFSRSVNLLLEELSASRLSALISIPIVFTFIVLLGWRLPIPRKTRHDIGQNQRQLNEKVKIFFDRERIREAYMARTLLIAALPKGCFVGTVCKRTSGLDPYFEISFPEPVSKMVFDAIRGAGDVFRVSDPQDTSGSAQPSPQADGRASGGPAA